MTTLMMVTERQAFEDLDEAIRRAHTAGELDRLAAGYAESAALYERQGEVDAACFYWTQAYVMALDAGIESLADGVKKKLEAFGRID